MKEKKFFSPVLMIAGLLFLADPAVSLFNVLPDSIGCFLIALALSPLAEAVPHFAEARDAFRKMMIVSLIKLPCGIFVMFVLSNGAEYPMISVMALAFAVLDLIFLFQAFKALFEGYAALAMRFSVEEAVGGRRISHGGLRLLT